MRCDAAAQQLGLRLDSFSGGQFKEKAFCPGGSGSVHDKQMHLMRRPAKQF